MKTYRLFEANVPEAEKQINDAAKEGFEVQSTAGLGVHGRILVLLVKELGDVRKTK